MRFKYVVPIINIKVNNRYVYYAQCGVHNEFSV